MAITKEQFERFETIRESGVTNMFAISTVSILSKLSLSDVKEIMENYSNLKKKYQE